MGYGGRKYPSNQHLTIRACAAMILEAMNNGVKPETKKYSSAIVTAAYRLLLFERIISRNSNYRLTEIGKKHIANNWFEVYKAILINQEEIK